MSITWLSSKRFTHTHKKYTSESYPRRLRFLLLYLCYVFRALINSLVCWFCTSALGLVLFQIVTFLEELSQSPPPLSKPPPSPAPPPPPPLHHHPRLGRLKAYWPHSDVGHGTGVGFYPRQNRFPVRTPEPHQTESEPIRRDLVRVHPWWARSKEKAKTKKQGSVKLCAYMYAI